VGLFEDAENFVLAQNDVLLALDLDLGAGVLAEQHPSRQTLTSNARIFTAPRCILPFPTAITLPSMGFSLAESGMMIPPLALSSSASTTLHQQTIMQRAELS
jgi:hypothetical protein